MNENLFTFPGGTADASGDNPFDLSGFTELTGNNTQNPFADLLAGGEATEQPPAEGAGAVQADDSIPEEKDETDQNHETVEEDESHEISKSPAPQDPQPKSPPAPKSEEDHASDKPEEAEDNPRLAAMERQEEKTAPKVAEPIFAQLPVFSYNGSEAPIEDTEQTFDELRLSKLTDFPEFDEAQSLSWKVVYGKIVKEIVLPKKTKIGQIKREIETSKEFINALKKATDKHPKCLVKPSISMQKKGDASAYKGAFLYLSEAQASPKTITFIPGRDGKVYERRITGAGEFVTPAENITVLDEIRPGFHPSLPRIPYSLMEQAIGLFRTMMRKGKGRQPAEALVHFYWDKQEQRYFIRVPKQIVSGVSVDALLDDEELMTSDRYIHYADLHSHNRMPAVFSKTDDHDERATRVYIDSGNGEYTGQIVCGIRRAGKTVYKPVGMLYPEVSTPEDLFPTEVSCAEASVSAPQTIVANLMAATAVVTMIYNILVIGCNTVQQTTFSTKSVNIRSFQKQPTRRKAA